MTTYSITNKFNTAHLKSDTNKARACKRAKEWAGTLPVGAEVVVCEATGLEIARYCHLTRGVEAWRCPLTPDAPANGC